MLQVFFDSYFNILFYIISLFCAYIYAKYDSFLNEVNSRHIHVYVKCLPIWLLTLKILYNFNNLCLIIPLIFSSVGDHLLAIRNLIKGVTFFALAQLCYIIYFNYLSFITISIYMNEDFKSNLYFVLIHYLLVIIINIIVYKFKNIINEKISILILYAATIIYNLSSIYIYSMIHNNMNPLYGIIIFAISDLLVLYDKFVNKSFLTTLIIMSLYYMGQYMITSKL